jgi:DNA-binding Lrp family transcriptional regulator
MSTHAASPARMPHAAFDIPSVDEVDRRLILATQAGLPLVPQPYHAIAAQLGLAPEEVMARLQRMQAAGVIRRIGAVPNHYALGYRGNGMSVWDVPDDKVRTLGRAIGELDFVSHCYHRPRALPDWPYNLFAMVHGRDRGEVEAKVAQIARLLGDADRGHAVLYSTRILKKTGLRLTE